MLLVICMYKNGIMLLHIYHAEYSDTSIIGMNHILYALSRSRLQSYAYMICQVFIS